MASSSFPHLLAPGAIGSLPVRNRLVMSPMETMYGTPDGIPSERTRAYFAARARGGVGLITVGATGIDPQHPETPGGLHLGTDEAVPAHRALTDAVHEHGARIQPQIVHAGPDGLGPEMHGVTSLGPSVIASYLTGRPSAEISVEQWHGVLDLFRAAARRVREAGYDGLELHAAHGYMLLGSFLAPQRNRRTDGYRGHTERGRWRAVFETLAAIRGEIGGDFPITLRVSGYERVAGGRPLDELARMAPALVDAGVDAFHVSGGVIDRYVTRMVNGADDGDGLNVGAAAVVREVVDVPVIAVGRIHDPELAERILADGRADFIAMGRSLLADPDLPRKLSAGQAHRVRRCISCENCIDALESRFSVDCAVNPHTGRELTLDPTPAPVGHVVVVGGGPAGLTAALRVADAGSRVTLLDQGAELGGALIASCLVHPENTPFLTWLRSEISQAGVEIRLETRASADLVDSLTPDAVVVATGGRRVLPDLPGLEHAMPAAEVWSGDTLTPPPGRRVAVVGGSLAGVQLAEALAGLGRLVAVFTATAEFATEVGWKRRTELMDRLDRLGVTVHTGAEVAAITPAGLHFTPSGGREREHRADAVLVVGEVQPDLTLRDEVAAALPGVPVQAVGDAVEVGLIRGAVLSAIEAR